MIRLPIDEIDWVDHLMVHLGKPFTGVMFEENTDGVIIGEMAVENGILSGLTRSFYPSGERQSAKMYLHNVLHGTCEEWHEGGAPKERAIYEFGILIERTVWDANGQIVSYSKLQESDFNFKLLKSFRKATWETISNIGDH